MTAVITVEVEYNQGIIFQTEEFSQLTVTARNLVIDQLWVSGPGSSWGNLATKSPSKEGESPSNPGFIGSIHL